ncbi:FecR domain-containing protein [Niabella yanshanensis]|uniref:FecR domain-containing protein n=1 Tax=Niabella yanshanensis TaxID=577386 RepID=A0ABZ0W266_9BACT|nr:FecR family protein [Niabella yanshanensis]WQD36799.1 FecR domain-containing protein [Niabella yanshanensis]
MQEDRFFILFTRKLSGSASPAELEELEGILCKRSDLRFFFDELIKPASRNDKDLEQAEISYTSDVMNMQLRGLWDTNVYQPDKAIINKRARKKYLIPLAAVLLIAAGIGFTLLLKQKDAVLPVSNETATTRGSKSTVKLPDGTIVMLNANSSLKYDENFKTDKREVTLQGEAYFDVAHDSRRPFIIHTPAADIKVLGTVFNVRSFKNGDFETALIKGKVCVFLKNQAEGNFVLSPGQKLMVQAGTDKPGTRANASLVKIDSITVVDSLVAETSWTRDQLVFADKPLVEIAAELENIFDVKIIFKSNKNKQIRYNGSYNDTNLDEILEIINMSKPIKYYREKDTIFIE